MCGLLELMLGLFSQGDCNPSKIIFGRKEQELHERFFLFL